jgi:opacity protein-like surface antigen
MKKGLLSFAILAALGSAALAADLPPVITKGPVVPICTAGNCSGAYATFGLSNNADLGAVVTGGANNGMGINFGGGYQYWSGPVIAGVEFTGGYQFGTAGNTGSATSTQFVKLGYNFFPSNASAQPLPSQGVFSGLVPANLLANSTPSVIAGGCLGHGIEKGCAGLEVDTVIASSWSTAFQWYNAPSVKGAPDENVFRIMVQKHF